MMALLSDVEEPLPPTAICSGCDATVLLAAGELPPGWEEIANPAPAGRQLALCPDCVRTANDIDAMIARPVHSDFLPGTFEGPAINERVYAGCRIAHWLVGGNAVLRIHGGGALRHAGRDQPIHFLATPADLDAMIERLTSIRASLATGAERHG